MNTSSSINWNDGSEESGRPAYRPIIRSPKSSNRNLFLAVLVSTMASFSFGYTMGFTSPALPLMVADGTINESNESIIGSIMMIGCLVGALITGELAERLGRKATIMCLTLPYAGGWVMILTATSQSAPLIIAGRFFTGVGVGMSSLVVPMYISEISLPSYRGLLGSMFQITITVGILIVYSMGCIITEWRILVLIGMVFPVLLLFMMFMPETAHWYLKYDRRAEATKTLIWLRGTDREAVADEISEIEDNLDRGHSESLTFGDFKKPFVYKPIILSCFILSFQQLSGIGAVITYSVEIFQSAGIENGALASVYLGVIQVVATLIMGGLMDRAGRKVLLVVSGVGMVITDVTFGAYFAIKDSQSHADTSLSTVAPPPTYHWLALSSMLLYITLFSLGWGGTPWLLASELLPQKIKRFAGSLATACNWLSAFIVTLEFKNMSDSLGEDVTFWIFAGITFLSVLFVTCFLPETKGKSLEEIEEYFARGGRNSSVRNVVEVPPPLETDYGLVS